MGFFHTLLKLLFFNELNQQPLGEASSANKRSLFWSCMDIQALWSYHLAPSEVLSLWQRDATERKHQRYWRNLKAADSELLPRLISRHTYGAALRLDFLIRSLFTSPVQLHEPASRQGSWRLSGKYLFNWRLLTDKMTPNNAPVSLCPSSPLKPTGPSLSGLCGTGDRKQSYLRRRNSWTVAIEEGYASRVRGGRTWRRGHRHGTACVS